MALYYTPVILPMVSKLLEFSWMESIALVRVASLAVSPPLFDTLLLSVFSSLAETSQTMMAGHWPGYFSTYFI